MLEKLKIAPEDEAALRHLFEHKVFGQYFISQIGRTGMGGPLEFMPATDTMDMQTFIRRDENGHYTQPGVEPAWWAFKEAAMHTSAFGLQVMVEHAKLWGWPKPHPWAASGVQPSQAQSQPTPYGLAGIEGDSIVIRLTADACAFAFANDPQAREPRPPVIDKQRFLRDTLNELTAEREDGSTPLTDTLDRAMVKAMENGSDALDHDAAGVPAAGLTQQLARAVEATEAGHDPLCMSILRGKACSCGFDERNAGVDLPDGSKR